MRELNAVSTGSDPSDALSCAPSMSTRESLSGIIFEPSRTFKGLRDVPRFLTVSLILVASAILYHHLSTQRAGRENIVRASIEANRGPFELSEEEKQEVVDRQSTPGIIALGYLIPIVIGVCNIAGGAALYFIGVMIVGGNLSYKKSLAVWTYSSYLPTLLATAANIIALYVTSPEELDLKRLPWGLACTNLSWLTDEKSFPVLSTALAELDYIAFYGLFLAATGLRQVAKLSTGDAWVVVLGVWIIFALARIGFTAFLGTTVS
jgi:hypothetical protein